MKPAIFQDPAFVPKTMGDWEAWIWYTLEARPNLTKSEILSSQPSLNKILLSRCLNKLQRLSMIAAVKYAVVSGSPPEDHYSIACKNFVPTVRKRNTILKPPIKEFDLNHTDGPIKLVHDTAKANKLKGVKTPEPEVIPDVKAETLKPGTGTLPVRDYTAQAQHLISDMSAPLAKAVYIELQALFGPMVIPAPHPQSIAPSSPWRKEIRDLFTVRTQNVLMGEGLTSLDKIAAKTPEELLNIPSFGINMFNEVNSVLRAHGLRMSGY